MSPDSAALAFLLDGPLQSWGTASRFQRRGTGAHPSKSGVLGLIAAALGINKHAPDEAERLRPLAALRLTTCRIPRPHQPLARRLTDYHTVGGGYDATTPAGKLSTPRKASGGSFGTVVTQHEYLTEAVFAAILEGPCAELERIARALEDPVWGVWLGRKCCVPAVPVLSVLENDAASALKASLIKAGLPPGRLVDFDRHTDFEPAKGKGTSQDGTDTFADTPLNFGVRRHATRSFRHFRPGQEDD
jgi:CRISPR system Cascade subunit CasD